MKKEVYVMYEQRYGELIVDNPPAEILGVYSSEEKAREELKNQVFNQDEGWVVDENCLDDEGNFQPRDYALMFWEEQENLGCYFEIVIKEMEIL